MYPSVEIFERSDFCSLRWRQARVINDEDDLIEFEPYPRRDVEAGRGLEKLRNGASESCTGEVDGHDNANRLNQRVGLICAVCQGINLEVHAERRPILDDQAAGPLDERWSAFAEYDHAA